MTCEKCTVPADLQKAVNKWSDFKELNLCSMRADISLPASKPTIMVDLLYYWSELPSMTSLQSLKIVSFDDIEELGAV